MPLKLLKIGLGSTESMVLMAFIQGLVLIKGNLETYPMKLRNLLFQLN
ncbi:hypothetical protein CULT_2480004 [[Clostridium] ultunense Esp]|nr:hypothetical protein CULT_2480004 [[Clostridium] ultunense Esp]